LPLVGLRQSKGLPSLIFVRELPVLLCVNGVLPLVGLVSQRTSFPHLRVFGE
ncbi:Hypothetical protein FKW44_008079, partial [Caligus rogercresseyi]